MCERLSDMRLFTLEIGAALLRSVTEIASKSPFFCVVFMSAQKLSGIV